MTEITPIRVMLVDDHLHVHEAIVETLALSHDITLVAQAGNGLEAITLVNRFQPDLILMDIVMPKMNGIEATKKILAEYPDIKILALSSFQDRESVRAMLENGAVGFVLKDDGSDDLADIIRTAYKGKTVLSTDIMNVIMETPQSKEVFDLTERELEVLRLLAAGSNYGEVATELFISYSTVRFHVNNIITKMGVTSRTEAVALAAKMGIV
jgi:NarL family two-component system response regulator LiaR